MLDLEDFERARIIPVNRVKGSTELERRTTSILLAVAAAVPEFGKALIDPLGASGGTIQTFAEPRFELDGQEARADGLIVVRRASKEWSCLVEVKTGNDRLNAEQLNRYLDVCRQEGINGLLTISNEIRPLSGGHPTQDIDKRKTRKTRLVHESWMRILTEATNLSQQKAVSDKDQEWILHELIHYLNNENSGAVPMTAMPAAWTNVLQGVQHETLNTSSGDVGEVVDTFDNLIQFTSLRLASQLGADVQPVIPKSAKANPTAARKEAIARLANSYALDGSIRVQDTVAPIKISVDLNAKKMTCAVEMDAPGDKGPKGSITWLTRQLREASDEVRIDPHIKNLRKQPTGALLRDIRLDADRIKPDAGQELRAFTVVSTSMIGTGRSGKSAFIASFLAAVESFYRDVVQNLQKWEPKPRKLKVEEDSFEEQTNVSSNPEPESVHTNPWTGTDLK